MSVQQEYWDALDRLIKGEGKILPSGSPINKDTVALEAGRKRGTIKKSRKSFENLIAAIESATPAQKPETKIQKDRLVKERRQKNDYRELYHQALNRELMLIERLAELEKELDGLKKQSQCR